MGRHTASPAPRRLPRRLVGVLTLAALTVGVLGSWLATGRPGVPGFLGRAPDCPKVTVATTADFVPVVRTVARRLTASGPCATYTVVDTAGTDVEARALESGALRTGLTGVGFDHPDVWIPDSLVGVESMRRAIQGAQSGVELRKGEEVASSPVVLAVPRRLANRSTTDIQPWASLLSRLPLSTASPVSSTPASLSFISWWGRLGTDSRTQSVMSRAFLSIVRSTTPLGTLFARAAAGTGARAFPASEQQIARYNTVHGSSIAAATPEGDLPTLHYTFVRVGRGAGAQADAVTRLETALTSADGRGIISAFGFRVPGLGAPRVDGVPVELPDGESAVAVKDYDRMHALWRTVTRTLRVYAVVDVSGSMAERVDGSDVRRIDLAGQAVRETLSQLKTKDEAALWTFSSPAAPGDPGYTTVVPFAAVGGGEAGSQRSRLVAATRDLPGQVRGDTRLYATILAAFQDASAKPASGQETLVVVITDGRNDDPLGTPDEASLIRSLGRAWSADHPVRLVLIAMGQDADVAAMRRITAAVSGTTYVARSPADVVPIFAQAVWEVDGVG